MIFVILIGIIGYATCGFLTAILFMDFGFDLMTLSLFYVPVGALIFSTIASLPYFLSLVRLKVRLSLVKVLLPVMLILITFVGIQYYTYTRTYMNDQLQFNYSGEGKHISEIQLSGHYDLIDFPQYYWYTVEYRSITVFSRTFNAADDGTNLELNWILEGITILFLIVGVLCTYYLTKGSKINCDHCKKNMHEVSKDIFSFDMDETLQEKLDFIHYIATADALDVTEKLQLLLDDHKDRKGLTEGYMVCTMVYCSCCGESHLLLKPYHKSKKKKASVDLKNSVTYKLDATDYSCLSEDPR